ncbi:GDSL-type esterase/lipase family protein [Dyella subtropica]|uniref:GDSL-type esterase/lipase family protein n=1 Tax=Dyella subtropica TaxID=2992127 RepID=UPI00225914C0|nr:hypothetical protein [Dyella subtropica]
MAHVSRFITMGAWCMGFIALSIARPTAAQDSLPVANISDLACPNAPPAPKPPSGRPSAGVSMVGTQMPSDAELGPLARTVIRDQPVLDPSAISGFALGDTTQPRRIAFWGDSHIAGGPLMPTIIETLRSRGLSVAPRFLPPTMGRANINLPGLRAYCIGSGWSTEIAYTSATPIASGPALMNRMADAGPDSYLWLDLRNAVRQPNVRQLQLVYRAPAGATIGYTINDGEPFSAPLAAASDSQTLTIRSDRPISTIKLRVTQGKLVLYGLILDYIQPPTITFDVFGLPSATVRGWANADPDYLAQTLHGVNYDGVVLEYGTNEGAASDFDADKYAATLTQALTHLRKVFPSISCVLVGPPDRGSLRSGKVRPLPLLAYGHIHQRIEGIQRQVGNQFGCTVWSWQDLMGGPGGSYGWAHAQPSMMGRDLIHLSPDGYRRTGRALAHSLGWGP